MNSDAVWQSLPAVIETGGLDPESFLHNVGHAPTALAICLVHQRRFRIYRECLVQDDPEVSDSYIDGWIDALGDLTEVEKLVNHTHVWDLVQFEGPAATLLGQWLADGWQTTANRQFPDRAFDAAAFEGDGGPQVTIWTARTTASRESE